MIVITVFRMWNNEEAYDPGRVGSLATARKDQAKAQLEESMSKQVNEGGFPRESGEHRRGSIAM